MGIFVQGRADAAGSRGALDFTNAGFCPRSRTSFAPVESGRFTHSYTLANRATIALDCAQHAHANCTCGLTLVTVGAGAESVGTAPEFPAELWFDVSPHTVLTPEQLLLPPDVHSCAGGTACRQILNVIPGLSAYRAAQSAHRASFRVALRS